MSAAPDPRIPRTRDEELIAAELPTVLSEETDQQRLDRMRAELAMGFEALAGVRRAISVFGSARVPQDAPEYALGREVGYRLGQAGLSVITGGGPGMMEAANRGAMEGKAPQSIGLNIELPFEQQPNPYQDIGLEFHYFFTRKIMFVRYASAFVVLPGGFGTLDECFEALVLIQTGKVRHFPVILIGRDFWGGLLEWIDARMEQAGMISERDRHLVRVTDDLDEVVARCVHAAEIQWTLKSGGRTGWE